MEAIIKGGRVKVETAGGAFLEKIALSGPERGSDLEVVWVCRPEEWDAAKREEREPDCVPWPSYAVEAL
jgi:hypothetical protein